MTKLPKLSIYKRYNIFLIYRQHIKRIKVLLGIVVILSLSYLGLELKLTQANWEAAETSHKMLLMDILKYDQPLGAPGTTWTDWKEGTHRWKK